MLVAIIAIYRYALSVAESPEHNSAIEMTLAKGDLYRKLKEEL